MSEQPAACWGWTLFKWPEGRYLAILPREHEEEALRLMRGCGVSAGACAIGRVEEFGTAPLLMTGRLGVERVLGMPSGMQLPRIC